MGVHGRVMSAEGEGNGLRGIKARWKGGMGCWGS